MYYLSYGKHDNQINSNVFRDLNRFQVSSEDREAMNLCPTHYVATFHSGN